MVEDLVEDEVENVGYVEDALEEVVEDDVDGVAKEIRGEIEGSAAVFTARGRY